MKKTILFLLSVLMVVAMVLTLTACADKCSKGHSWDQGTEIVPATCGESGLATYVCEVCARSKTVPVPATGNHDWSDWTTVGAPAGQQQRECKVCHTKDYQDIQSVPPCTHGDLTKVDAVAHDCTTNGNVEYWKCNNCKKYFADSECTQELAPAQVIDPAAHTLGSLVAATDGADCQTRGTVAHYECAKCDKWFADEQATTELVDDARKGELGDHVYGSWQTGNAPADCTSTGTRAHYECEKCHLYFDEQHQQLDSIVIVGSHSLSELKIATVGSDCQTRGTVAHYECAKCDKWFADEQATTELTGDARKGELGAHKLGTKVDEQQPSCSQEGHVAYYQCSKCLSYFEDDQALNEIDDIVLPTTAHSYTQAAYTHDSGDEFGFHHRVCDLCGQARESAKCNIVANECSVCSHTYSTKEILDALFALSSGSLSGTFTLTGVVTQVASSSNFYMNVNDGNETRTIYLYNLRSGSAQVSSIVVGATVEVSGTLKNYNNGTYEFDSGTLNSVKLPDYTVNIDDAWQQEEGIVSVALDRDSDIYKAGETVTLTVVAKANWQVVVVVTLNDSDVTLTVNVSGNQYSFVIIGDVTVTVTATSTRGQEQLEIKFADTGYSGSSYQNLSFEKGGITFEAVNIMGNGTGSSARIQMRKRSGTDSSIYNTIALGKYVVSVTIKGTGNLVVQFANNADFEGYVELPAALTTDGVTISASSTSYMFVRIVENQDKVAYVNSILITYQDCTHVYLDEHSEVPSTCYTQGTAAYWQCRECGQMFADAEGAQKIDSPEQLQLKAHNWVPDTDKGDNGWTWSVDNGVAATLSVKCDNDGCVATHDVTANVTYQVTDEASCTKTGLGTYTAKATYEGVDEQDTYNVTLGKTAHTYTESNWVKTDKAGHYHLCEVCTNMVEADKIAHVYTYYLDEGDGNHLAYCDVCNFELEEEHHWSATPAYVDGQYHQYVCTSPACEGAQDPAPHVYNQPDGTCECGAEETHVHNMVWANDNSEHWKHCDSCDFVDNTTRQAHVFDEYSSNDETYHNAHCETCRANITLEHTLTYEDWGDVDEHYEKCQLCTWEEMTPHNFVNGVCKDCNAAKPTWQLVTDANINLLKDGASVVFASNANSKVAGAISSGIMAALAATFDGNTITDLPSNAVVMTLGTSGDYRTFTYNGNKLASTAAKNVAFGGSGTATWTISVDKDGNATVSNSNSSYGKILYNVSSPRFTTYTSNTSASMLLINLYVLASGTSGGGGSETPNPEHVCNNKCDTCQGCKDADCGETACANKCNCQQQGGGEGTKVDRSATLTFSSATNSKGTNGYGESWSATCSGVTWNLNYFHNNNNGWNYVKAGNKSTAYVATITTAVAWDWTVTQVVMKITAITASAINSISLEISSSSDFTKPITSISGNKATGDCTFNIPENLQGTNYYYRIVIDCKASSNGTITVESVAYSGYAISK